MRSGDPEVFREGANDLVSGLVHWDGIFDGRGCRARCLQPPDHESELAMAGRGPAVPAMRSTRFGRGGPIET